MHFWYIWVNNFEMVNSAAMKLHDFFYFSFILVLCEFQLSSILFKKKSVYYLEGWHASIDADAEMQVLQYGNAKVKINWHSPRINIDLASTSLYFCNFYPSVSFLWCQAYFFLYLGHCASATFVSTDDAVRGETNVCCNFLY